MAKEVHVLFLDDEEHILNSMKRSFINEGYGIATTTDPDEAMKMIAREKIKVVVSDQRMPKMTGIEFLREVKEGHPDIVRILFTGYADVASAEDAINVGEVYRFIHKPWNVTELKVAIRQATAHFDLIMENQLLLEETKQKKEELEVANRKLKAMYERQKEFTSTVSHELRTPLASIKSTVDLVLSESTGKLNEDQTKFLRKTKDNVDRLKRLINDVLDLTKMEAGKSEFNVAFHDLRAVINDVAETEKSVAQAKGLYLKTELPEQLPQVPFDIDKIHQVFSNLLSNAVKFTEKGGIVISCIHRAENNQVEVCIQDTGGGIKKEDMDKLFQKFQQLDDPQQHVGGTGLGLAICKEIIERHGGKIWVESTWGEGSYFKFVLPIQERREQS